MVALESRVRNTGRKYRGFESPLEFFRSHKEYRNLIRSELAEKDQGLYRTLSKHGQLEDAIPEKHTSSLSKEQVRAIVDSYKRFNGNARKTASFLGLSGSVVRRYWNKIGLRALGNIKYRGRRSPLEFFRSREKYRNLTRFELVQKDSGLYRTLLRHGQLEEAIPEKHMSSSLSEEQINEIVKVYKKTGKMRITARITHHNFRTVSKYLGLRGILIIVKRGR